MPAGDSLQVEVATAHKPPVAPSENILIFFERKEACATNPPLLVYDRGYMRYTPFLLFTTSS